MHRKQCAVEKNINVHRYWISNFLYENTIRLIEFLDLDNASLGLIELEALSVHTLELANKKNPNWGGYCV